MQSSAADGLASAAVDFSLWAAACKAAAPRLVAIWVAFVIALWASMIVSHKVLEKGQRKGKERAWAKMGEAVTFTREMCNKLNRSKREGEENLEQRIKSAKQLKTEAERLRRETEKKWENDWWDGLAEDAEKAERR